MPGMISTFTVPFLTTLLFIAALRPAASRIGLVDRPGGRKQHDGEVPLIGGLSMTAGLIAGSALVLAPLTPHPSLLIGTLMMALVGALDDRFDLAPWMRLIAQGLAGMLMVNSGVVVQSLGNFGGVEAGLGWFATAFTVLTVMAFLNAFNWQDGSDGIAGGQALIFLTVIFIPDWFAGSGAHVPVIISLAGCVVAFLMFNAPFRKKVGRYQLFMGDAGALFLGFALVWLAVSMSQGEDALLSPATVLWIGAIPVMDFFGSMMRRVALGRTPLSGDAEHLHHLLTRAGLTRRRLFYAEMCTATALSSIGLSGHFFEVPQGIMLAGFIALFAAYYWVFCSGRFFERSGEGRHPRASDRYYFPVVHKR